MASGTASPFSTWCCWAAEPCRAQIQVVHWRITAWCARWWLFPFQNDEGSVAHGAAKWRNAKFSAKSVHWNYCKVRSQRTAWRAKHRGWPTSIASPMAPCWPPAWQPWPWQGLTLHWQGRWGGDFRQLQRAQALEHRLMESQSALEQHYLRQAKRPGALVATSSQDLVFLPSRHQRPTRRARHPRA